MSDEPDAAGAKRGSVSRRAVLLGAGAGAVAGLGVGKVAFGTNEATPAAPAGAVTDSDYLVSIEPKTGQCVATARRTDLPTFAAADAGAVLDSAIRTLAPTGGKIGVLTGVYPIHSPVRWAGAGRAPAYGVSIWGSGRKTFNSDAATDRGTVFKADPTFPSGAIMFDMAGVSNTTPSQNMEECGLYHCTIDGGNAPYADTGVRIWDARACTLEKVFVRRMARFGLLLGTTTAADVCYQHDLNDVRFDRCPTSISTSGTATPPFVTIRQLECRHFTQAIAGRFNGHIVSGGYIGSGNASADWAIDLDATQNLTIESLTFENNPGGDIHVSSDTALNQNINIVGCGTSFTSTAFEGRRRSVYIEACRGGTYRGNQISYAAGKDQSSFIGFQIDSTGDHQFDFDPEANYWEGLSEGVGTAYIDTVTGIRDLGSFDGAARATPDLIQGHHFTVTLTGGATFELIVNAPRNPVTGRRIVFEVINAKTAGGLTLSWNPAGFKQAYTAPARGRRNTVAFVFDGKQWVQDGRQGPDLA